MIMNNDILIVGGGMVGLAMAIALADSGLRITLLERDALSQLASGDLTDDQTLDSDASNAIDYDLRVSAISPGNQDYLRMLGAWQNIPTNRIADYERMQVWDGDGTGHINFDAAELGKASLGSIVENRVLRSALYRRAASFSNIQLLANVSIDAIHTDSDRVEVSLNGSERLRARLLIGADGALSNVRQQLGIEAPPMSYEQHAFVANVKTEYPHQSTAWQRFTNTGPVAFLPLPQPNLCSIVWSIDNRLAQDLQSLSMSDFGERLGRAFEHRLGKVRLVSEFRSFPLIRRHTKSYLAPRGALIGDAAHTIHPLAGQGVNLGFQDVECLSRIIHRLTDKARDIGLSANLRMFERERKAENTLMQSAMGGFKWLFSNQSMPIILMRNIGLSMVDQSGPIKHAIIRRAMGL